jgi:hypothetical protein
MNRKLNSASLQKPLPFLFGIVMILTFFNAVYCQDQEEKGQAVKRAMSSPRNINFQEQSMWDIFYKLTETLNINIVFHASVQPQLRRAIVNLKLDNVSYPQAIKVILDRSNLDYVQMDERTIMIVKKSVATSASKPFEDFVIRANEIVAVDKIAAIPASKQFPSTQVVFNDSSLMATIEQLAKAGQLAVEFDDQFAQNYRYTKVEYFVVRNTTFPQAMQLLLDSYDLKYSQLDRRSIKIGVDIANPSSIPLEEIMSSKE